MSYVEVETGKYVKRWAFWNPETWIIPKLYWDAWSQEQRIHAICRQLEKVIKYADYLGVNTDEIASRLTAIEQGQIDDLIVAAIEEWFAEHAEDITRRITDLETEMESANDAIEILQGDVRANTVSIGDIETAIGGIRDDIDALDRGLHEEINALDGEIDTLRDDVDRINALSQLQSIGTIETMDMAYRELNFDSYTNPEDMQGGIVYEIGTSLYYSFVTGTDAARTLRTVSLDNWGIVSNLSLDPGHYGVISIDPESKEIYIPAYRDSFQNYGTIYVYDASNPVSIHLKREERFNTSYGVQALVFKSPGVYLIEGNPTGALDPDQWSGIYEFDYAENTYTFLFNLNRKKNGERSQPFVYDLTREMIVAPTVDNASMAWYDLEGNEIANVNIKDEYDFMSFGEYENVTVLGSKFYIGSYFRTPMNESRALQLWEYNVNYKSGKNVTYVDMPSSVYTVTADYSSNNIIPLVVSNANPVVKFPNDAINIARRLTVDSGLNVMLAFAGNYPCGLYVNGFNGQVDLSTGTFARGVVFYNSRIVVTDVETAQFVRANSNASSLSSRTRGAWSRASALTKPAYISFINTQAILELVRSMADITLGNIYTMRFVASDVIINTSNMKNAVTQYSGIRYLTNSPSFDVNEFSLVQG